MCYALTAADVSEDLGGALVSLALRIVARAGPVGAWLPNDPGVAVADNMALLFAHLFLPFFSGRVSGYA
jgi:hypothetical protein